MQPALCSHVSSSLVGHSSSRMAVRLRMVLPLLGALLMLGLMSGPAHAQGNAVYASGDGISHVRILRRADASFTHEIYLVSPVSIFIGLSSEAGKLVQLGHFPEGTELEFAIYIVDTGDTFYTGPASRNPDDIEHAAVSVINPKQVLVGFEDLFGGGDFDYNDVLLRVKR
jgi:hypothetical protein